MARNESGPAFFRITQLARSFGLSRSTLLYYDRIGLLCPTARTGSNYREYTAADRKRLAQICRYRAAGLSLADIARMLAAPQRQTARILEQRLDELNHEIQNLREQQRVIVDLLKDRRLFNGSRALDKKRWVAVLRAAGLDDEDMLKWHRAFETMSPEAHQDFLESLGIAPAEVAEIRSWSADRAADP